MKAKFAKAFANNITAIAENTTRIVLLDAGIGTGLYARESRAVYCRAIRKAEANIAEILMQPGAHPAAKD